MHSMLQVLNHPKLNHQVEVTCGVLAARCMDLLQRFFREKRQTQCGESQRSRSSGEMTPPTPFVKLKALTSPAS